MNKELAAALRHLDQVAPIDVRGNSYHTVAMRVAAFRRNFDLSEWRIRCKVVRMDAEAVCVEARIQRRLDGTWQTIATGHAEEARAAKGVNATSAVENCETSAVGRALAFLGLGGDEICSLDELLGAGLSEDAGPSAEYQYLAEAAHRADFLARWKELDNDARAKVSKAEFAELKAKYPPEAA